jgi:hypothetical protein
MAMIESAAARDRTARGLAAIVLLLAIWSVASAAGAGFSLNVGRLHVSAHEPLRPAAVAIAVCLAGWLLCGAATLRREVERLLELPARLSPYAAIGLALLTVWAGLRWGTFVAGGSDSYGYVSQADLWLNGQLRVPQPLAARFNWTNVDQSFAPLGYQAGTQAHTIVPTYSAGVPILMAIGKLVIGENGPFVVVPILGGLAVWLTYRLGRRVLDEFEALMAALLLATSPAFLFQLMNPMSDVAAMAMWMTALLLALGRHRWSPWLAGLAASCALVIRPNLPLVAIALALAIAWQPSSRRTRQQIRLRDVILFAPGVVFAAAFVMTLNAYLYGSPLTSGYGTFSQLYAIENGPANLRLYASWLWQAETPLLLLAPLAFVLPGALDREPVGASRAASARLLLAGLILGVVASYVFYVQFTPWWYLRFLLTAYPALMVAAVAGLAWMTRALPRPWHTAVLMIVLTAAASAAIVRAERLDAFNQQPGERRYQTAARGAEAATPPNAVILCVQHSGSVRYYGHRLTLRWDFLVPGELDRVVADLQAGGYKPYVLLESWESPRFREFFATASRAGRLDWKPAATPVPDVSLYELPTVVHPERR